MIVEWIIGVFIVIIICITIALCVVSGFDPVHDYIVSKLNPCTCGKKKLQVTIEPIDGQYECIIYCKCCGYGMGDSELTEQGAINEVIETWNDHHELTVMSKK